MHQLKPYTGWPIFKSMIEQVLSDYEEEAPFRAIRRLSLRYVNRLPLPEAPYKIEAMTRVMPQIPDSADQLWASWFQQVEIVQPQHKAILGVRAGKLPGVEPLRVDGNGAGMAPPARHWLLDLVFAHAVAQPVARQEVSTWLDTAHSEIETLFFKSLQPEYLQEFEPEEEEFVSEVNDENK